MRMAFRDSGIACTILRRRAYWVRSYRPTFLSKYAIEHPNHSDEPHLADHHELDRIRDCPGNKVSQETERGRCDCAHLAHTLDLDKARVVLVAKPWIRIQHFASERFLLLVHHDLEQLVVLQGRVQEPPLHLGHLCSFLVDRMASLLFGLFGRRLVVAELVTVDAPDPNLECNDQDDGRCSSDGIEPLSAYQSSGCEERQRSILIG